MTIKSRIKDLERKAGGDEPFIVRVDTDGPAQVPGEDFDAWARRYREATGRKLLSFRLDRPGD